MTVLQPGRHAASSRGAARPAPAGRRATPQDVVGHLSVDASHHPMARWLAARRVRVVVDDLPLSVPWGRTDIALPPGRHRVEIAVDRGERWGHVVDAVPVAAGHTVDVYYRAPLLPGRAGALGPEPHSARGTVAQLAALGLAVLLLGVAAAGAVLATFALLA